MFEPLRLVAPRFIPARFIPARFIPARFIPARLVAPMFIPPRLLPPRLVPLEVLRGHVHPTQVHPAQVHPAQVGAREIHPAQVHPAQVHPGQVHPGQIVPGEIVTDDRGGHRLDRLGLIGGVHTPDSGEQGNKTKAAGQLKSGNRRSARGAYTRCPVGFSSRAEPLQKPCASFVTGSTSPKCLKKFALLQGRDRHRRHPARPIWAWRIVVVPTTAVAAFTQRRGYPTSGRRYVAGGSSRPAIDRVYRCEAALTIHLLCTSPVGGRKPAGTACC